MGRVDPDRPLPARTMALASRPPGTDGAPCACPSRQARTDRGGRARHTSLPRPPPEPPAGPPPLLRPSLSIRIRAVRLTNPPLARNALVWRDRPTGLQG